MNGSGEIDKADGSEVAIIGMACRVPGAINIDEFRRNLWGGVESVTFFSDEELQAAGVDAATLATPSYVKAGAVLEGVGWFDASFFGFNPREAEIIDPQQRLFLECAWEALESAGYDPQGYEGRIGLYAGAGMNFYLPNLYSNHGGNGIGTGFQIILGNDKDFLTTRVSYKLDLRGPSITVQTACSTSLVAVCLACESLLNYQCGLALAGGVSILLPQRTGYYYQEGGVASPDGHCRAFDAKAQGTVGGSGAGIVVLKRLSQALADGDCIHAVIKGTAINNDGSSRIGYTAPGIEGQAQVIKEALAVAGVDAETISYIEAHGSGTSLGDAIEIAALKKVFGSRRDENNLCAIGSVKTNVGHLDTAAGVVGLLKTVLAIKHRALPPSLNFQSPNPSLDLEHSPFYVNTKLTEWKSGRNPRRAGVSSFGIGGTNAHVILEEAPGQKPSHPGKPWQLLTLSARSETALENATDKLADHLKTHPAISLADAAYTLKVGRRAFNYRRALVCRDAEDAIPALQKPDPNRLISACAEATNCGVAFMFPGQGAQYVNMGLEIYHLEQTFREQVDQCCELLRPHLGFDLREALYPSRELIEEAAEKLKQTDVTQPALFVIEYALAKLWMEWGVRPAAMIGHSIGEYVAACLAGVITLADALALVAARGRLMQSLPDGAMLAVPLPEKDVLPLLSNHLSLAVVNGTSLCVVSGPTGEVAELEQRLTEQGLGCRRLHASRAFHSRMMDSILEQFTQEVKKIHLKPPTIPYLSNVTGAWIRAEEATDPNYWARHMRQAVRFADGVGELVKRPDWILLEVGPGRTLMTIVNRYPGRAAGQVALASLPPPQDVSELGSCAAFLLTALGRLWVAGVQVDWSGCYAHERRCRIPLPTYSFERERFWVEPLRLVSGNGVGKLGKNPSLKDWFYVPSWKRSCPALSSSRSKLTQEKRRWALFVDECGIGDAISIRLEQSGQEVTTVRVGERFQRQSDGEYRINPNSPEDYVTLTRAWQESGQTPEKILHLWNISRPEYDKTPRQRLAKAQVLAFYSLLFLAQGLGDTSQKISLLAVTNNMQEVNTGDVHHPEKALALGPCRVIRQEYMNLTYRSVDITLPDGIVADSAQLCERLIAEALLESSDAVAHRGGHRWIGVHEATPLEDNLTAEGKTQLRTEGVYLITGGLGGIGLELGKYLSQCFRAKLVLVGRTGLPARQDWPQWLDSHPEPDKVSRRIRAIEEMERVGAEVLIERADVADFEAMQAVIKTAIERFGHIHGVIHAAGVPGGGLIQLKTAEAADTVLRAKAHGLLALSELFKDQRLDFIVMCSSQASILGGFGQIDYTAANAFLDAYAHASAETQAARMIAINWNAWKEVGMAVATEVPEEIKESVAESLKVGLSPSEGVEVFLRILGSGLSQVVVSTLDFAAVLERNKAVSAAAMRQHLLNARPTRTKHQRPRLSTEYVAPRNEIEERIAQVWQELLGLEQVGVDDDFMVLGGHSLLAIQLISRLRRDFEVNLSLPVIFEFPTVAELALIIEDIITSEVEALAEDEVLPLGLDHHFGH